MSEPVALVSNMCNDSIDWKVDPLKLDEGTPLYTHPVKDLTDEEIYEFTHRMIICSGQNPNAADINIFGLARIVEDILRKAQQ